VSELDSCSGSDEGGVPDTTDAYDLDELGDAVTALVGGGVPKLLSLLLLGGGGALA
jgi:hypothetical protein